MALKSVLKFDCAFVVVRLDSPAVRLDNDTPTLLSDLLIRVRNI
jgi:hypothetical protein